MSKESTSYYAYASEEIAEPGTDYWVQRRRIANLIRDLQEHIQTTNLPTSELQVLGDGLQKQIDEMEEFPKLEGRMAWADAETEVDWGMFHTELTPVIGACNPISPGLSIWFTEDGRALATVTFSWMYEGAENIAHGGWIAAVFDEFIGTAQILSGKSGMTGHLTTRYHKPTPLNRELRMEAKVKSVEDRKITMVGEMWAGDVMTASAEGVFVIPQKHVSNNFGSHN